MGREQDKPTSQDPLLSEELVPSEDRWRGLVATAPDIILIINPDGAIRYINRTAQGYKVENVIGTCSYDYVHEDHRATQIEAVQTVLQTGEIQCVELAAYGTDGSLRWYTSRLGPYWEDGKIVGVTSIATDITEHKLAEQRLEEIAVKLALPLRQVDPQSRSFQLDTFSLAHMNLCGAAIRGMSIGSVNAAEVAGKVVRFLYERFVDEHDQPALALVRCFETCPYEQLDEETKGVADSLSESLQADTRCMRLLATAGDEAKWNDPQNSVGHRVIPLLSENAVERLPMIAHLMQQLGMEIEGVLQHPSEILLGKSSPRVFHVANAKGSEYIPAQADFVERYDIESVIGFGDVLPNGHLFVIIMFSKIPLPQETANLFSHLSLSLRIALLPFIEVQDKVETQLLAIDQLLRNQENIVASQEKQVQDEQRLLRQLLALQESERRLITHEIHDGLMQEINAAHMHLEATRSQLSKTGNVPPSFDLISELITRAIVEGRRMISDLRPMIIDEQGIVAALEHLVDDERIHSGLTIDYSHDVQFDRLDSMLEGSIYRIVQEALNNVKRHAETNRATVTMFQINHILAVEVRDQGTGFEPDKVSPKRFGLRSIRERARLFGGEARIESKLGEGTLVVAELPIDQSTSS